MAPTPRKSIQHSAKLVSELGNSGFADLFPRGCDLGSCSFAQHLYANRAILNLYGLGLRSPSSSSSTMDKPPSKCLCKFAARRAIELPHPPSNK